MSGHVVTVLTRHPTPGAVSVAAATSARVAVDFPVSRSPRWCTIHNCQQNKYFDAFYTGTYVRACMRVYLYQCSPLPWQASSFEHEIDFTMTYNMEFSPNLSQMDPPLRCCDEIATKLYVIKNNIIKRMFNVEHVSTAGRRKRCAQNH